MTQKGKIIELLKNNGSMTQGMIAETIYGDKDHTPNVYSALTDLVSNGVVKRTEGRPAYYTATDVELNFPQKKTPKRIRDVSGDVITNDTLDDARKAVEGDPSYGEEMRLVERFP